MLKPLVPKFRYDLSTRSKDVADKQVAAKLKPIVVTGLLTIMGVGTYIGTFILDWLNPSLKFTNTHRTISDPMTDW